MTPNPPLNWSEFVQAHPVPEPQFVKLTATWQGETYDLTDGFVSVRPWPDANPFPRLRLFRWLP